MATTLIHESDISKVEPTRRRAGDATPPYAGALAADLRERIEGEVRFSDGDRALYATDGSNYRQAPIGVVIPKNIEDVVTTVAMARKYGAPILSRGGGTSLAGQCCNTAVVMDFTKYINRILDIDYTNKRARVQPGLVLDILRHETWKRNYTFGPDPATHNHCTFGGMLGNNSCGMHAQMAGKAEENVDSMEVLTYDGVRMHVGATSEEELESIIRQGGRRGQIYAGMKRIRDQYGNLIREKYPRIPRRVSGYNLNELLPENGFHVAKALVGSEGTLATTLEATVRLVYWPPFQSLVVLGYPDIYKAADHLMEVLESKPIALEGLDHMLIEDMDKKHLDIDYVKLLPPGKGWLMVQFGGDTQQEANDKGLEMMAHLKRRPGAPHMKLFEDKQQEAHVWAVREAGLGATAFVPGSPPTWEGWEDSAVAPEKVAAYLRDLCKLYEKFGYEGALYGHFGQGCIHTRITFDFFTAEGIDKYKRFMDEATTLVTSYGGSLSGEHGDGQSKAQFLVKMFGPQLIQAFREFKSLWDPEWKMNPGKVVDPYRIDENLRLGTDYNPPLPETHFHFRKDGGSFSNAALRCVGVGECRRHEEGIMCPSYRATMEEKHSTRGRAHLLFEMMNGEVIKDGWKSEAVFDALDLCLACKGCKTDCPMNVDMATYKAEFLSHYYEGKRRPRHAYSMGLIYWWARLASLAPGIVNFVTQMPGLSNLAKFAGGIAQQRSIPKFASVTFKDWFRKRGVRNADGPQVILWADTFNNYFHPEIAAAAVEVLEAAGYRVLTPAQSLCCGRPLYDFGMLDTAENLIAETLASLRPHIQAGTPIVGLEPSCVAVFRDEMPDLFPHDEDAKRLAGQFFTLSEFLEHKTPHYKAPKLERKAIIHGHCHHRSALGFDAEKKLYADMKLDHKVLDDTCCGMAGSFGFEEGKYDVSMKVGNLGVLKSVREASKDTIIIADGFSCRTQIEQGSNRRALHTAQVLKMALEEGSAGAKGAYPEKKYLQLHGAGFHPSSVLLASVAAGALLGGGLLLWNNIKSRQRV